MTLVVSDPEKSRAALGEIREQIALLRTTVGNQDTIDDLEFVCALAERTLLENGH